MSVLAEQRKQCILDRLETEGKVMVIPLASHLEVSAETIRRDMAVLEKEGKLKRVYGGAIKPTFRNDEAPYTLRQKVHLKEKRAIGKAAAELIQDGSTIAIDVGTTPLELARAIQGRKKLTVFTNSLPVAACLLDSLNQDKFTGKIILLGGEANPGQRSINGPMCERMAREFRIDQAFLSAGGISLNLGISDYDLNEASMSRTLAEAAQEVIVLADHSKLGVSTFASILPLDKVDMIVTSAMCPADWTETLAMKSVQWVQALVNEEGE